MKKIFSTLLALLLIVSSAAAEETASPKPSATPEPAATVYAVAAKPTDVSGVDVREEERDIKLGEKSNIVYSLQERLLILGFCNDKIDGIYGKNTAAGVSEAEKYIRELEQKQIDEYIASITPSPSPTEAPTPEPTQEGVAAVETPTPTPSPTPSPKPTPEPTPETMVDGTADIAFQKWINGDPDDLYFGDAALGDISLTAKRVQMRLVSLNYLNDKIDGKFGINTETAIKAFQEKHGLEITGIADRNTQKALFSEDALLAKRPVYNLLEINSSGDTVKAAQQQLILLGFMTGTAGGYFNESTRDGVKAFETYMYKLDHPTLTTVQVADATIQDNASKEELLAVEDPETNPYEVTPEEEETPELDGFEPTGKLTNDQLITLLEDGIPVYSEFLQKGNTGDEVKRLQRRLISLNYLTNSGADGIYGGGTEKAILNFQNRNKLAQTGTADRATQVLLYSDEAIKAIKPYFIKVSTTDQRVYVYTHDDNDEYNILVKTFVCSTGLNSTPTPKGTFTNTGRGARWHYFTKFDCWAQYAWYIDGDIMFHSVLYAKDNENTLYSGSVSALGSKASHGCVRLAVDDVKWIWDNCSSGTKVQVY